MTAGKLIEYFNKLEIDNFAEGTQLCYIEDSIPTMIERVGNVFQEGKTPSTYESLMDKYNFRNTKRFQALFRYNIKTKRWKLLNAITTDEVLTTVVGGEVGDVKSKEYKPIVDSIYNVVKYDNKYFYCNKKPCAYDGKLNFDICYALCNLYNAPDNYIPKNDYNDWDPELEATRMLDNIGKK